MTRFTLLFVFYIASIFPFSSMSEGLRGQSPILVPTLEELQMGLSNPDKYYGHPITPPAIVSTLAEKNFEVSRMFNRFLQRLMGKAEIDVGALSVSVRGKRSKPRPKNKSNRTKTIIERRNR